MANFSHWTGKYAMNFEDYQDLAARTMNDSLSERDALSMTGLGLAGEAGETVELIKKHNFHGKELDREKLKAELGDVLWYLANMARSAGISLRSVAEGNIAKLRARYPQGFQNGGGIR